ncbi:MAG TPA: glycosyltransferase [Nitrospira sp.]|jgi:glycosyltransferase involved in cell wall biosynthesis|nr:glycosyltransferase [Nitrospira sp.]
MFLIRSLDWYGGAQRQLVNLASGLSKVGHDVTVVTYYSHVPLERELAEAGVEVRSLGKRSRWDLFQPIVRFLCLVRKLQPTVIHGYLSTANILAVMAKACCPSLKVAWGLRASNMHWDEYDWLHKMSFVCERALSRFADLLIVNSYAGRDHYASSGFPIDKMIVIHNGIDTARFRPDKEAGSAMKRRWGIDKKDRIVCLVGRLDPMKDHITFLRAAALLAQRRSGLRFVCVGQGASGYENALRAQAEREGVADRIMWVGCFYDMKPVYNACDVVVSSSVWGEGFPNVLAEAIACGVPCVATDVGDSSLLCAPMVGTLVPPGDPASMAKAIESVLDADPAYQPATMHEQIVRSFGREQLVRTTEGHLARLACL